MVHAQPVIIFGGFLSYPGVYREMAQILARWSGQRASVVPAYTHDWLALWGTWGWRRLLTKLDKAVHQALQHTSTGKVTLVGHSMGGVLARLYLSPKPFRGWAPRGLEHVDHLITLGSPHYAGKRVVFGGRISSWIETRYPGAFFAPTVRYTSVAGKLVHGDLRGSPAQRLAYRLYRGIRDDGDVWGDGLVPLPSALLGGANHVILDGVAHFRRFGRVWYGDDEAMRLWWVDR